MALDHQPNLQDTCGPSQRSDPAPAYCVDRRPFQQAPTKQAPLGDQYHMLQQDASWPQNPSMRGLRKLFLESVGTQIKLLRKRLLVRHNTKPGGPRAKHIHSPVTKMGYHQTLYETHSY